MICRRYSRATAALSGFFDPGGDLVEVVAQGPNGRSMPAPSFQVQVLLGQLGNHRILPAQLLHQRCNMALTGSAVSVREHGAGILEQQIPPLLLHTDLYPAMTADLGDVAGPRPFKQYSQFLTGAVCP